LWRTVSHERDLTLEEWKSVRSPAREGEGAAETTCDELTATPNPCPPVPLGGGRGRETGLKLSLERREGWGEDVLSSLSYSDLIGDKLNLVSDLSLSLSCSTSPSSYFLSPDQMRGSDRVVLVGTSCLSRPNQNP